MERYIKQGVFKDLNRKMVFVGGPRQVGKTTFAKNLLETWPDQLSSTVQRYYSWDDDRDREFLLAKQLPFSPGPVILDELHKYQRWRWLLKALYDKRGNELQILVTGSAKLDYYRRGGDSLQGRYHYYRLHPLSLKELSSQTTSSLRDLLMYGGFPEPFFSASETETRRWSREYRSRVLREELRDLEKVNDISLIERMAIRLPTLVGNPLSLNALREDLQVSHQTVVRWMNMLERLYSIFRIYPFGAPHIRAVKKEAKHYHFDWAQIPETGFRFENMIACHLLKWCHFFEDTEGWDMDLRYFRDTDKREVDFVVLKERTPILFVECKISFQEASGHLKYLSRKFPGVEAVQIYFDGDEDIKTDEGIRLCPAATFLKRFV